MNICMHARTAHEGEGVGGGDTQKRGTGVKHHAGSTQQKDRKFPSSRGQSGAEGPAERFAGEQPGSCSIRRSNRLPGLGTTAYGYILPYRRCRVIRRLFRYTGSLKDYGVSSGRCCVVAQQGVVQHDAMREHALLDAETHLQATNVWL